MSTQTNPSQYPEQPSNVTPQDFRPQDFVPDSGPNTGYPNGPDAGYVPPRFTRPHGERPHGERLQSDRQHDRQSGERSIPEFLQRPRGEPAPEAKPARPRPPLDTVVPVLDDQAVAAEAPGLSPYELDELEREITRAHAHPRRSLSPEFMPAPPLRPKGKVAGGRMTGLTLRLILVAAIAVFFILLMLGKTPMPDSWKSAAAEPWRRLAALIRSEPAPSAASVPLIKTQAAKPTPKLVVEGADAGNNDEIALGVRMTGPVEGVMATVTGLVPGTKLSRGQPWGNNEWLVPAHELAETKLRPPADFSGTMQYTVSLRTSDNKIADRQTLRLQWSQTQKPQRHLEQDEITTMITRGQAMLESGDIASARLLLQRAAESGDQNAAMAMAATYDPAVMNELGVRGVEADVQKARYWYQKASEYGSKEAPKRLESLASQSR
jgi:hypothetical protein